MAVADIDEFRGTLKNYDVLIKGVLVGDSGVGKSCFLARFAGDHVNSTHISTIGVDFKLQTVVVDDMRVRVQLWDTAGQERFHSLTNQYYKRAQGVLLVYDITSITSFQNVRQWMARISQHAYQDACTLLIANKYDLASVRVVSRREGETLAKEYGVPYMETSAMDGYNVKEVVQKMCRLMMRKDDLCIDATLLAGQSKSSNGLAFGTTTTDGGITENTGAEGSVCSC